MRARWPGAAVGAICATALTLTGCQLTEVPDQEAFACAIEPCPRALLDAGGGDASQPDDSDDTENSGAADGAGGPDASGAPDAADTSDGAGGPVDVGPSPNAHPILPNGCEFDGEHGCRCDKDLDCNEGVCAVARDGQGFCTRSCVNSCADDGPSQGRLECQEVERIPAFFCVDSWLDVGAPCRDGDDCLCAVLPADAGRQGAAFCSVNCSDGDACPAGFSCRGGVAQAGGGPDLTACVPDNVDDATTCPGALTSGALALPGESICTLSDGSTTCSGELSCADDGSWTACDAPAPVSGTCAAS